MDAQEFITYLEEPGKLGKESLDEIQHLSNEFPYCQSLRILHLLNLHLTDQLMFSEHLKTTAAYIADRKRLKELIAGLNREEEMLSKEQGTRDEEQGTRNKEQGTRDEAQENKEQGTRDLGLGTEEHGVGREEVVIDHIDSRDPEPPQEPAVTMVDQDEEARLLKLKKILEDRLNEIQKEKEEAERALLEREAAEKQLTKEEIIDRFIEEEPSISRPKSDFFDPVKNAKKSQQDTDGIVSETLANIHLKQGNTEKAIEIYRKLSLKFPEKSSYFAARIEKLKRIR